MRLLQLDNYGQYGLTSDLPFDRVPPYAILSHTWGSEEVEFTDLSKSTDIWQHKAGFHKIEFCAKQAKKDGLRYFWVDSCCIDKSKMTELQTAINSMFRWYRAAKECYVYLADVSTASASNAQQSTTSWERAFQNSRWFTRGWTLQELLAPQSVAFFSKEGIQLGDKKSLEQEIHHITGIPISALRETASFNQFGVDERMKWAEKRSTTHAEDWAYCLLGIFDILMPLNYGEGRHSAILRLKKEIANTPKRQEWLQKLYICPYQERKDRNPPRVEKTCDWFTNHSVFQQWCTSNTAHLLWVSADPGCGKSVLAKYLIDDVLASTISRTTSYFFFKEDFQDQRSSTTALCSLLHQIFHHHPMTFSSTTLDKFEDKGPTVLESFVDLWDILISATSGHEREFICVLDALDECETSGRNQLINAVSGLSLRARLGVHSVKFLLLSRPYVDIARNFHDRNLDLPTIHLAGENEEEVIKISQEIDIVIRSKVADMSRTLGLDHEKQNMLVEELTRIPNRTYLWIHLIFDEIRSTILLTKSRIQSVVRDIPRSLSEAYDKILSKSRDIILTRKLLHIVISATRPLTLREMSLALAINSEHQSITDLDSVPEEQFRDDLRQLCGLFLVVVDFRIYLLHQTAREFLISPSARKLPHLHNTTALRWEFSFEHEESHRILAEICVQRLSFADLEPIDMRAVTPQDQEKYFAQRTFLQYAAQHWADHFREASWHQEDWAVQKAISYCHSDSPNFLWYSIYQKFAYRSTPSSHTPLLLASYFGLNIVLEQLPKRALKDINFKDDTHGRSAISWAAEAGYDALVKRLLSQSLSQRALGRNPHINTKDKQGSTPLGLASKYGHDTVLQHLLQAGADINTKDDMGRTPLGIASERGHATITQHLLDSGAKVNLKDQWGSTPLGLASEHGYDAIIQCLLQAGADTNTKDDIGRTPLGMAAEHGHNVVLQQLLQAGCIVNTRDGEGCTPLGIASGCGHNTIVRQLLQAGANVNIGDDMGRTPLLIAFQKGHDTIVQQLLQAGADVNTTDGEGYTTLRMAAERGDITGVQQLLQAGVNINIKDGLGRTPLWIAFQKGHDTIVQQLLQAGADVNTTDGERCTPLRMAAERGNITGVQQLLQAGAFVNTKDGEGHTPLGMASGRGHNTVVQQLLQSGAIVNMRDGEGRSPLWLASERGQDTVVQQLLQARANVDTEDKIGRSPLWIAFKEGHDTIVQQLLQAGADVNTKDGLIGTPLGMASGRGNNTVVQQLLEAGADVNTKDVTGRTPLGIASENGHVTVVQQLLQAGANINTKDVIGRTPLRMASGCGHNTVVQQLLQAGANANIGDDRGSTPLWIASNEGHDTIVQQLLQAGAVVDTKDGEGRTLLGMAAERGYNAIVQQLLQAGADVNRKDREGRTPLGMASEHGHDIVVHHLLQAGADVNMRYWVSTPLILAYRRLHDLTTPQAILGGPDTDTQGDTGRTPLGMASERGYDIVVRHLLQANVDINIKDKWGRTPLRISSEHGHATIIQHLIDAGADLNMKDEWGDTALGLASERGYNTIVQLLIKAGADINAEDTVGYTPLKFATRRGHDIIIHQLLQAGAS